MAPGDSEPAYPSASAQLDEGVDRACVGVPRELGPVLEKLATKDSPEARLDKVKQSIVAGLAPEHPHGQVPIQGK